MSTVKASGLVDVGGDVYGHSQKPWDDRHDFSKPKPMGPARKKQTQQKKNENKGRFKLLSDIDIESLQYEAKSDKTHKATKWAVTQLTGMFSLNFYEWKLSDVIYE